MKLAARIYSTFFGFGFVPLAPGTAASLAAAAVYKYFFIKWPWPLFIVLIAFVSLTGSLAATSYSRELGHKDPRRIVVDEAAGQWVTLILAPAGWVPLAAGFVLFRLFDVLKPIPIRKLETLPAGWGIMADDLAAGVYAWIVLRAFLLAKGTLY
jgi:phosphatidylglycerophosphatase A